MAKTRKLSDGTEITHAQNDARYVERGRHLALSKEKYESDATKKELDKMNKKKNGRPYEYPNSLLINLALIRVVCGLAYRDIEGMTKETLGKSPHYTQVRRRILDLDTDALGKCSLKKIGRNGVQFTMLPDGTGLEPSARGEFIRAKHKVRRGFIRWTAIVDHDSLKITAYELTDERTGEASDLENTIEQALENMGIDVQGRKKAVAEKENEKQKEEKPKDKMEEIIDDSKQDAPDTDVLPSIRMMGDGFYSKFEHYEIARKLGIDLLSPVPINASAKTRGKKGGHLRKQAVLDQLGGGAHVNAFNAMTDDQRKENRKKWRKEAKMGRRWLAEIGFSAFKRVFGSAVQSRTMENIAKEMKFKVYAYNRMIDVSREAMGVT